MSNIEEDNFLEDVQKLTWLEAIEKYWLQELFQIFPEEVFSTVVDLVATCKGLLEIGLALEDVVVKLYDLRIQQEEDSFHRIAEDEFTTFLTKEESLLLENIYKKEVFKFFTEPISTLEK